MATRSDQKTAANTLPMQVVGDHSTDRFIYLAGEDSGDPPNLREAWVNARRFWITDLPGGTGTLVRCLEAGGIDVANPTTTEPQEAISIYMLTNASKTAGVERWCVGQAIVAGEKEFSRSRYEPDGPGAPLIVLDFNQGWLKANQAAIPGTLADRPFLVRTHDPCQGVWQDSRRSMNSPGLWFSPIQDMADGSLWFDGAWDSIRARVANYLRRDDTLFDSDRNEWLHFVVVQVQYDGALVFGPGLSVHGDLLIFKGDQPRSFERSTQGTVVAGGIVFTYSLATRLLREPGVDLTGKDRAKMLLEATREGLVRIRDLVRLGYAPPPKDQGASCQWQPESGTNLPAGVLGPVRTTEIISYSAKAFRPSWNTACEIVSGADDLLRRRTPFRLGNLIATTPEYADTLLRLARRLESHVSGGKGVLSFSIFGGPGSGKSFVAEEVAAAADATGTKLDMRTFNLSQFTGADRLLDAFKQIQTIGLQGKIPIVIWDEFDTVWNGEQCGWLSSFLMPMQDHTFFDGHTTRALGKSVFVFVGGTFKDDPNFVEWTETREGKRLKGPDFHSRLSRSLAVPAVDAETYPESYRKSTDPSILVRAVMIRTFLRKTPVEAISREVLAYLLHVPLQHGVRSLKQLVNNSELSRTRIFRSYHMPPEDVLALHVKSDGFSENHSMDAVTNRLVAHDLRSSDSLPLEWKA